MTIPNGQTGLRSDARWSLSEAAGLREELQAERKRHKQTKLLLKQLEDAQNMDKMRTTV